MTDPSRKQQQRRCGGIAGHVPAEQPVIFSGIRTRGPHPPSALPCQGTPHSRVTRLKRKPRLEFVIWVETRLGGKTLEVREVASIARSASGIEPEELGLTLEDGKTVLKQVQAKIVQTQVSVQATALKLCRDCNREQRIKDRRTRKLRTVFGAIDVSCCRYIRCTCLGRKPSTLWPLGIMGLKRSTPELTFLLAKWGSKLPYRRAAELLREFLLLSDGRASHATVRRHTLAVGAHLQRVTEPDEYDWPVSQRKSVPSGQRLTVAID